ncbi:MAG: YlxR family protein [Anaerolineae bacterium]|nr:YlxR family protein [Anaerolineae bacterium]
MTKNKIQPKQRHIPERTCIACRERRHKRDLLRVVHTPSGAVVVDETGKQNGRGAYLCRQRSCWEKALKQGSLDRALRTTLTAEILADLRAFAATLPETLASSPESVAPVDGEIVVA